MLFASIGEWFDELSATVRDIIVIGSVFLAGGGFGISIVSFKGLPNKVAANTIKSDSALSIAKENRTLTVENQEDIIDLRIDVDNLSDMKNQVMYLFCVERARQEGIAVGGCLDEFGGD